MQRWTVLLFLGLVALAVGLVLTAGPSAPPGGSLPGVSADARGSASAARSGDVLILADTSLSPPPAFELDAGTLPSFSDEPGENADAGATQADGSSVPALGSSAPRNVKFGLIMVFYRGAQGAPRDARTREEALKLAGTLAEEARTDFARAAAKGDVGMADAGSMSRNVLEPAPEYTLFSLGVGEVGGPVDSPRGFYVFKRND
jgi:hypothetical protein